ncbi:hypothetical protein [Novosphingobium album (ex Hu et al. 2023)]|uniref:DNA primase n=1 Tax=Novosphingobium album (ex Hu et al. 2023) TaxID=2930093 RepID=A0ABT0B6W1_9SPHN|nr:hypothetical protein [Novosphingobium album (ex Hu et al. 2023)]MCJ2180817.1 hypothetical protein [Novosphingobium album (ex Hu et al. 2023)]
MTLDIERLQALFQIGGENPITLRALAPKGQALSARNLNFRATEFPSVEARWAAFAEQALHLNDTGYNIYTCMNPILPNFTGDAVKDEHILSRRLLLIDLDRSDTNDAPATDDEIKLAGHVADDIEGWLRERWNSEPTRVMSGNGIHLYYPLDDLPNDQASRDHVRNVLSSLAGQFVNPTIKVDTSVSNASRITKVPGTIARKGTPTEGRPFRKAVFQ